MADDTELDGVDNEVGSGDNGAVEAEAAEIGWVPREQFKGNPDHWVDAETFLERGRTILPIVQENNRRLTGELRSTKAQVAELTGAVKAANATLRALEESRAKDVEEQVKAARRDLLGKIKQAREEHDMDVELELQSELNRLDSKTAEINDRRKQDDAAEPPPGGQQKISPEFAAWAEENPWVMNDARRVALANAIAQEFRQAGDETKGRAFLDKVAAEVTKVLGAPATSRREGKVGGGGVGAGASSGGKGYASLPADAKAECDRQRGKFVGPGRAFKTDVEWRAAYAKEYFAQE